MNRILAAAQNLAFRQAQEINSRDSREVKSLRHLNATHELRAAEVTLARETFAFVIADMSRYSSSHKEWIVSHIEAHLHREYP